MFTWLRNLFTKSKPEHTPKWESGAGPKPRSAAAIAATMHVNANKHLLEARALSRDFLREGAEKRCKSYGGSYGTRHAEPVREEPRRDTEDLAMSAAVAASTHNVALGYMVGGSLAGAIIGSSMAEAASSAPSVPETSECYRSSSYDPSPSYSSSYSSDSHSSSSSCDSSSSYSSSSDSSSSYSSSSDW